MTVTILVAAAQNGTIGADNDLPWHLPKDLKRFKSLTKGHTMIMGRRTWDSIGRRPLPRREHIVMTRQADYELPDGVLRASSLAEALRLAEGREHVFLVGGSAIYREGLAVADRIEITRVLADVEGDTKFPEFDPDQWNLVWSEEHPADDEHTYPFRFETYDRKRSGAAPMSAAAKERTLDPNLITIVSGLPRSGTSMMMKMLEAGGMPVVTDGIREADVDNPKGCYEFERVKQIKEDSSWIPDTRGKVFKMVSLLLYHLPPNEKYRVVLMRRDTDEILASERKMLERLGKDPDHATDERMSAIFEKHLQHLDGWLKEQNHIEVREVWYNDVMTDPGAITKAVAQFCDGLDAAAMEAIVDPSLYRNRKG